MLYPKLRARLSIPTPGAPEASAAVEREPGKGDPWSYRSSSAPPGLTPSAPSCPRAAANGEGGYRLISDAPYLFLSYRRSDSPGTIGRIYDRFVAAYGRERVFKDVDSIPLGVDFREHLGRMVDRCDVLIAVIGDDWLEARDDEGNRRLDDPADFVRVEIEQALERGIPVIPVLVRGAAIPSASELPDSLQSFAWRNSLSVRADPDFHTDMDRLICGLQRPARTERRLKEAGDTGGTLISAAGGGVVPIGDPVFQVGPAKPAEAGESLERRPRTDPQERSANTPTATTRGGRIRPRLPLQVLAVLPIAALAVWGALETLGLLRPDWPPSMVSLPGGTFLMGSGEGGSGEQPVHEVTVPPFELSRTEVTVAQYARCVEADVCDEPAAGERCNWNAQPPSDDHPINCVSWHGAELFAEFVRDWLPGARLPTEAEWEYAARDGGKDVRYPWGDAKANCARAVTIDCGNDTTAPVCSKPAGSTSAGVCDLAGNVWEWVVDDWHGDYEGAPVDGSAWVDSPRGASRVIRSGSFWNGPRVARAANRDRLEPDVADDGLLGFRLSRSLPSEP